MRNPNPVFVIIARFRAAVNEELESKLCPEMKALPEDFISENMYLCSLDETQAFIEGFKLTSKLFAEIYLQG